MPVCIVFSIIHINLYILISTSRWVEVLEKAVVGEIDNEEEEEQQTLSMSIDSPIHEHPESSDGSCLSPQSPEHHEAATDSS